MALLSPLHLQAGSYSALADRALEDAVFANGGVVKDGDLLVTQRAAGANLTVDIAPGTIVIPGTDVDDQGKYLCRSTAVENVDVGSSPGAGLSRIVAVYARVFDSAAIGPTTDGWVIDRVLGTTASVPTAPAIPASSSLLSYVLVGPLATSVHTVPDITDKRAAARLLRSTRTVLSSVHIGSAPPADTLLTHAIGTHSQSLTPGFGVAFVDIDLTSLGLTHGYTASLTNGATGLSVIGVVGIEESGSNLTRLRVQAFKPDGTTPALGDGCRVNYDIWGA